MTTHHEAIRHTIAGASVRQLAETFGTPLYVYDAEMIRRRCRDLAAWDTVRFAQKACSNLAVLNLVRQEGVMVNAVSTGEIQRALAAGYAAHASREAAADGLPPVHPIVYTADIFDRESLDAVARLGIHVNCGSSDMIEQLAERVPGANITLRVNPGFGHGHSQKTNTGGEGSKHGIWHEEIPEVLRRAEWAGLAVSGLHMHIGSGTDLAHLAEVAGALAHHDLSRRRPAGALQARRRACRPVVACKLGLWRRLHQISVHRSSAAPELCDGWETRTGKRATVRPSQPFTLRHSPFQTARSPSICLQIFCPPQAGCQIHSRRGGRQGPDVLIPGGRDRRFEGRQHAPAGLP